MKQKWIRNCIMVLAAYFLLLVLLVYAESGNAAASIRSLPMAFWYSLVTITTVGYGDLYPVTAVGRIIGVLFLLMSAGALTALISLGVSWLNGFGLPRLQLRRTAGRWVYLFDEQNSAGQALARNILAEDSNALCIFAGADRSTSENGCLLTAMDARQILTAIRNRAEKITVIFAGENAQERMNHSGIPEGTDLVCQSSHTPGANRSGLQYYDRDELCAAMYWQTHPLRRKEKRVLLVGFGTLGRRMLEYALESCILSPVRTVEYHVFGADGEFLLDHPALSGSVSIGSPSESRDSLFLHSESWNADPQLLLEADRIVFCSDIDNENLARYLRLTTYFPAKGTVHLYSTGCAGRELPAFGTDSEILHPETVLRAGLERMAKQINEIYREASGGQSPGWEALSAFQRRSNYASAQHVWEKVRFLLEDDTLTSFTPEQLREAYQRFLKLRAGQPDLCRRIEHDRWVRFHAMYNWVYAPVRCNPLRQHPMMVPFDELILSEQEKDDYAWELIGKLADRL